MKQWIIFVLVAAVAFALGTLLARTFMTGLVAPEPAATSSPADQPAARQTKGEDNQISPAPTPPRAGEMVAAAPAPSAADRGQALFAKSCSSCHTIGGGDKIGPDLAGVSVRRAREWLIRMITLPDRLRLEQDPIALELFAKYNRVAMPNLGLTPDDAAAILLYIASASDPAAGRP